MAYRTEQNNEELDIVIDGFEAGVADSPEAGIADARSVNITGVPKEASVNFSMQAVSLPPTGLGTISFAPTSTAFAYLVVGSGAGGGSGFDFQGGGGGAGAVNTGNITAFPQAYTVTVGAGGAGGLSGGGTNGSNGNSSSIDSTVVSAGGGGGAGGAGGTGTNNGVSGASGGGGSVDNSDNAGTGGAATAGFAGGSGHAGGGTAGKRSGGGGGGAGGVGGGGADNLGGTGGVGVSSSISGSSVSYAGGGGGGGTTGGTASSGGGAGGTSGAGTAGTANRGGGGGGSNSTHAGGAGGSGVVVISYTTGSITATGGSMTTSGGNTIHTFNSSSTFTISAISGFTANTLTVASTTGFYNGMAVTITASTVGGVTANEVYYVGAITATTFKLYSNISLTSLVSVTSAGTGTLTIPGFGKPYDSVLSPSSTFSAGAGENYANPFILDDTGAVWLIGNGVDGVLNQLYFTGNVGHSSLISSGSLGIGSFKGYILALIQDKIDYMKLSTFLANGPSAWNYGWQAITATETGHEALSATDDAFYFCNAVTVGSVLENAGTVFSPNDTATYTYNDSALVLPSFDRARCLAQLGILLLIGGIQAFMYPWDRVSTSFNYPIILAEKYVRKIVSTNANAYAFAGNRGRIYITNGANVQLFKKFPDHLANTQSPYYQWNSASYFRNQLYFSLSATTNAGVAVSNFAGAWAIDVDTKILRMENSLSYGTYTGSVPVMVPMGNLNPAGTSLYLGWVNGSNTGGIDYSSSTPYTNYESYVDTDIIPVGTYYNVKTFGQIEYKLSRPLVAGESVRVAWRSNLNDNFTTVFTSTLTGELAEASPANFQKVQWTQLRVSLASTASSPSYVRLTQLRLR